MTTYTAAILAVVSTLALFIGTDGVYTKAGKCKTDSILPIKFDFHSLAHIPKWKVIYTTDVDDLCDMDYDQRILIPNLDNTYMMTDIGQTKKKDKKSNAYKMSIGSDGVVVEEYIDDFAKQRQVKDYVLLVTPEHAIYFYRCSDRGSLKADTRFVVLPVGITLSNESRYLIEDFDKKNGFSGKLCRISENIQ